MPEPHVPNFMQLHEGSDIPRHVDHSLVMQLVARFAHANDIDAATSSAYLVFTSALGLVQFRPKVLTASRNVFTQVEPPPQAMLVQTPGSIGFANRTTCRVVLLELAISLPIRYISCKPGARLHHTSGPCGLLYDHCL